MEQTFEFLVSPKLVINDSNFTLALISNPRNVYEAKEFCTIQSNGTLYHLDQNSITVVEFAKLHGIQIFYIGLSDSIIENIFHNSDGTSFSNDINLWNPNEPDNKMPDTAFFCEGELLQF